MCWENHNKSKSNGICLFIYTLMNNNCVVHFIESIDGTIIVTFLSSRIIA